MIFQNESVERCWTRQYEDIYGPYYCNGLSKEESIRKILGVKMLQFIHLSLVNTWHAMDSKGFYPIYIW